MEYYPKIKINDQMKFPIEDLKYVIIGKKEKGAHIKNKYGMVMKISMEPYQPVYLDVVTGEIFDDINDFQIVPEEESIETAIRFSVRRTIKRGENETCIGNSEIRQRLSQLEQELMEVFQVEHSYDKNMYAHQKGCVQYELYDENQPILLPEMVKKKIEDDIYSIRGMIGKPHIETKYLYYGKTKSEETIILYKVPFLSYENFITNFIPNKKIGSYHKRDFIELVPFEEKYKGKCYPIMTPSLAYQIMKADTEVKQRKILF